MLPEITKENYKDLHEYMSYSTFSRYLRCEAAAKAHFHEPQTSAKLMSSYVDAYFSNELEEFREDHPEIFTRQGELKSDFKQAESVIERIKSDEVFTSFMGGETQKIMTGEICGVPFKIKMDFYKENEYISDLKVVKDFGKVWSDAFRRYTNLIEAYDYDIEMAIFQEIVFQNTGKKLPCYILAITKETPADIGVFSIPQNSLDNALQIVKNNLPRIKDIIDGKIAPHRCEKCMYCRETKKARVLPYDLIGMTGDELRENGIECDDKILIEEK